MADESLGMVLREISPPVGSKMAMGSYMNLCNQPFQPFVFLLKHKEWGWMTFPPAKNGHEQLGRVSRLAEP